MEYRQKAYAKELKKVNDILYDLHNNMDRQNEQRKLIYSLRGIIGQLIEFNEGRYLDEYYIAEKCNLIKLDSKGLYRD
jgi:hypothetical protein